MLKKSTKIFTYLISIFLITFNGASEELNMREILEIIQKDLRTLERAVFYEFSDRPNSSISQMINIINFIFAISQV